MNKLQLIPVPSTIKRDTPMFVDWVDEAGNMQGAFRVLPVDVYPPSPCGEALRHIRVMGGFGLRQAATLLGLTALELSGLERGSTTLSSEEWIKVYETIRQAWRHHSERVLVQADAGPNWQADQWYHGPDASK